MEQNRYVVIMAGGKGERFWPQSRLARPKHLLPIVGESPMLVQTLDRLKGMVPMGNVLIITNSEQRAAIEEICPDLPKENIIAEPIGRDTAAAVGLAALLVEQRNPDATFAMLPADHVIHDTDGFQRVLKAAFEQAEQSPVLVTVGIEARYAATGYGYIQRGGAVENASGVDVYHVQSFREKPDFETAQAYVDGGNFFWNAGMFVWQVGTIQKAFEACAPELWRQLGAIRDGLRAGHSLVELLERIYPSLEKISVDYAIMEQAKDVRVVRSAFDWDDVGEWPAIERHHRPDARGNAVRGSVCMEGSERNIVLTGDDHTVALVGVSDLIVVHTTDATLVCSKERAQEIKLLVQQLGEKEALRHLL
jgi:mannose-1-phosphate guanylyltransferase